jgi:hypothetical protein
MGWHPAPGGGGVRWANSDAVMSYYNPHDHPITAVLKFKLVGATEREVTLEHEGRRVGAARVGRAAGGIELPQLTLVPGVNRFKLRSREPAVRVDSGRYQLRTFGLEESSIKITSVQGHPQ